MTIKEAVKAHNDASTKAQRTLYRLMDQAGFTSEQLDEAIGYMRTIHTAARRLGISEATDRATGLFEFEANKETE